MYNYSSDVRLTKNEILKRISQEEIYNLVFNFYPKTDTYYKSIFRDDKNAGCFFEYFKGTLYFKDFADTNLKNHNMDCFEAVKIHFKLKDFNESLIYVDKKFNLGITNNNPIEPKIELLISNTEKISVFQGKKSTKNKEIMSIDTHYRDFNYLDKKYWFDRYGISKKDLIEDNTFPLKRCRYYSHKKKEYLFYVPISVSYCYNVQEGYKKIYSPFFESLKWITNCNNNIIGNIENILPYGYELIITKSYKDCRVLRNFGLRNVVWFSSENQFPNDNILLELINRFEKITIWYDNDETGKKCSSLLLQKLNELNSKKKRIVNTDGYKGKDISDIRYFEGQQKTEFLLKSLF